MVVKAALSAGFKQLTKGLSKKAAKETVALFGRQTLEEVGELVARNPEKAGYVAEAITTKNFKAINELQQEAASMAVKSRSASLQNNFVSGNYTRPDAVQNLQELGGQTKWGRTERTIQGPVPPRLDDKTFTQGAKSKQEAVMAGTTKYLDEEGIPTQIRNYGSDTALSGRTTKVGTRKTSGRGKTREGDTRKMNEVLATDPDLSQAEKKEFSRIMAEAAAEGLDGDHIIEIARVAKALKAMTKAQRKAYFKRFKKAGVALGNDPKNIQKLTQEENQVIKPAQLRAIDESIKNMDKRSKTLLEEMLGI